MNRKIEGTRTQSDKTSGNAVWETPPEVYAKLNEDFGPFDIDLTADAARHHNRMWFGPQSPVGEFDALTAIWRSYGRSGFSNPPYGDFIPKILAKAQQEKHENRFATTLLLPMRVTKAFKTLILPHASELLFADSRIIFHENGQPRWNQRVLLEEGRYVGDPAMFDSIIVRFTPGENGLRVGLWHVPEHGKWKEEYGTAAAV